MNFDNYMNDGEYMAQEPAEYGPCEDCCEGPGAAQQTKPRMIEVEEVLGTGTAETISEICINLCPPAFEVLDQLVTKRMEFDALVASKGKVFINGRVIKDIPYKTRVKICRPSCQRVERATYGNIRHVTVEVPFALCIDVPESYKGAKVVVLSYDVNSVEIPYNTSCVPNACVSRCENPVFRADPCQRRLICSITEKDCISVTVKVVRDVMITVPSTEIQC